MRQITSQPVKMVHHSHTAVFHLCNPTFVKNATLDACSAHVGSSAHTTSHHGVRAASQPNKELDTRNVQVTWKLGEFQGERFETSTDSKMEALSLTFWALVACIAHVYDESERFKSKVTKSRKTNLIWIEFRRGSDQAGVDRRKSHNCWNSIAVKILVMRLRSWKTLKLELSGRSVLFWSCWVVSYQTWDLSAWDWSRSERNRNVDTNTTNLRVFSHYSAHEHSTACVRRHTQLLYTRRRLCVRTNCVHAALKDAIDRILTIPPLVADTRRQLLEMQNFTNVFTCDA